MRELTGGRLLRRSVGRHRGRMTAGVLLLSGHQSAEALVPVLIGVIIDRAVATGEVVPLLAWVLVLGVLFTSLTTFWRWGARHLMTAMQHEMHQLRPALLAIADRVVVLDAGRIVATGTHADLAATDDRYREAVLR
ncbi:MAG: hypothetical protein GEV28_05545 [Actinophytocola sp.]|uniref:hypothetical protein n=1 Tax=Actinophytocola sp. TaxID=1872138 RepID=UPI001320975C|nr:hypothetical protein [Actinophytocola sp.]MPZ79877.1 hypothetical protein [Actinophytocola sp.]